jgi:hypothetical protein
MSNRADFVFTVSREFVRSIQTPLLVAPDDVPAHPYKVAIEVARFAPKDDLPSDTDVLRTFVQHNRVGITGLRA